MLAKDRDYKIFKEGDEVFTEKENWKLITPNKRYVVINCYKPPGMVDTTNIKVIQLVNDGGFVSEYASYQFEKTNSQIREDKLKEILN